MSVTTEQFNEMKARTESARQKPIHSEIYKCGFDAVVNGANTKNSHYGMFSSKENTAEWQRGYEDAKRESITILQPLPKPSGDCITDRMRQQKQETGSVLLVLDFWASEGVPRPLTEFRFCERRWRFDFAWPSVRLYLECQGGIWTQGRHTRGAELLKEWEKLNAATVLGWRPLFCQPSDLLTVKLSETIKSALAIPP